jgi:ribosomal protein S11
LRAETPFAAQQAAQEAAQKAYSEWGVRYVMLDDHWPTATDFALI